MIAKSPAPRSWRHTSEPSRSGSPRSNRTSCAEPASSSAARPVSTLHAVEAVAAQSFDERFSDRRVVLDDEDPPRLPASHRGRSARAVLTEPLPIVADVALHHGSVPFRTWSHSPETTGGTPIDDPDRRRRGRRRQWVAGALAVVLTAFMAIIAVSVNFGAASAQVPSRAVEPTVRRWSRRRPGRPSRLGDRHLGTTGVVPLDAERREHEDGHDDDA